MKKHHATSFGEIGSRDPLTAGAPRAYRFEDENRSQFKPGSGTDA